MSDALLLPPRLDLPAAAPLAQAFRERLGADIAVDASQVTHLGALCLQVLLSAAITARRRGHALRLIAISDRAAQQLAQMGFTPDTLAEGTP
ncbi:STAS domain-containing protein [Pseudooceanicola sp. 216_PA32_1]|uniref:STAS domain-containing protein n=1 Tax=Pseudooceanicola pacificus TaxID=2676438 RepID=A0A844W117_9RHOB|nr:STAS domain-containing protein [Pseudooceanicola pacificus]MWB77437.1 STAS domain-containing protein [Pseudooceanicola pacificus]